MMEIGYSKVDNANSKSNDTFLRSYSYWIRNQPQPYETIQMLYLKLYSNTCTIMSKLKAIFDDPKNSVYHKQITYIHHQVPMQLVHHKSLCSFHQQCSILILYKLKSRHKEENEKFWIKRTIVNQVCNMDRGRVFRWWNFWKHLWDNRVCAKSTLQTWTKKVQNPS